MSDWEPKNRWQCIFRYAKPSVFLYIKNFNASHKTNPGEIFLGIIIIISFEHDENICIFYVT